MKTLADLSRELPTDEELSQIFELLLTESDRGCALIAGSFLENVLAMTIACHLVQSDNVFRKQIFDNADAPLGTFAAKIKLGRALGIYDEKLQNRFALVKDIRNAFAHALRPLDFSHPTIIASCQKLDRKPLPIPSEGSTSPPARIRYTAFCRAWSQRLYEVATDRGGREMTIALTISD